MESTAGRRGSVTRLFFSLALVSGLALAAPPAAQADTTTPVIVDAQVREDRPGVNYENATTLNVSNSSKDRRYAYVKVDHPTVAADEEVVRHYLWVHVTGAVPSSARLYADRVGNGWTEANLAYNDQPAVLAAAPGQSDVLSWGWNLVPIDVTPGATQSYRLRTNVTGHVKFSSQENSNGDGPVAVLDTEYQAPPAAQDPSASRGSTSCGVVDVDYATGAGDNTPSTFVTTIDGVQVDNETVSAPSGAGGHGPVTLAEDSSGGSADVVVTGNGTTLLDFAVDTGCSAPLPTSGVPATPVTPKVVGMAAPAHLWNTRLDEVGACGVEARRIFGDLVADGRSQESMIRSTVAAGMTPVVSYKVPSVSNMINGQYDAWMVETREFLSSLGVQVTATFWHEPHGNMAPADFRTASERFLRIMKAPTVAVGPILNGWLLDRRVSDFASYTNPALLSGWDFFGIDTYQAGSESNPGEGAARGVYNVETWLDGQGFGDKPIVIGEYNGYSAATIAAAGEAILSTPEVWMGLVYNSDNGEKGNVLQGSDLEAYKATKADDRAKHGPPC